MILRKILYKTPTLGLAFLFLASLLSACEKTPDETRLEGEAQGTAWHVSIPRLPPGVRVNTVQAGIQKTLDEIDKAMSGWRDDSDLMRFNHYQKTDWFEVSPRLLDVVNFSQEVSQETQGAFDITVGPLVELWGFGAKEGMRKAPSPEQIAAARQRVGYQKLEVRQEPPALRKSRPDMIIDVAGIAQGYSVDVVSEYLESLGLHDYMMEIGGEVRARGKSPRGDAWRIAIEKPQDTGREVQQGVKLVDASLTTAGDYRDFFIENGKRYSHTIDPATGYAVARNLASVSVLTKTALEADAYDTALMAMGEVRGREFAEHKGLAAFFIWRTDHGFETLATEHFKPMLLQ